MTTIDFNPLRLNRFGHEHLASILNTALSSGQPAVNYPPYNIELSEENRYAITLDVAGFEMDEIDIQIENGVLTINGMKQNSEDSKKYIHQGFAVRPFSRRFNLDDYIEVTEAKLHNGLLTINLVKEIPEAMKPRKIAISNSTTTLEHQSHKDQAA